MDPPTETRAQELYLQILTDLETARGAEGPARDAVLLRVSDKVGELAEIAEGANAAPVHEGSWRRQATRWLARISWELVKILSDTDFYNRHTLGGRTYAGRIFTHAWDGSQVHPTVLGALAA